MHAIKVHRRRRADETHTHLAFQLASGEGVKGREKQRDREVRVPWAEGGRFCCFVAMQRQIEEIGYHSLTPNTFAADTMINEPGAVLQGLLLDPLGPPPPTTTSPFPLMLDPFHLDKAHLGTP